MGRAEFDPYGNVIANTIPLDLTDRLFTGQRFDPNTGLYDYRARFYDPLTSSFIQPDSIVPSPLDPRAWNRFSYVYGNPVNYTDPSGHFACGGACIAAIGIGIFTGAVIGGSVEYSAQAIATNDWSPHTKSWNSIYIAAGVGAIAGGITGGVGSVAGGGVSGLLWRTGVSAAINPFINATYFGATEYYVEGSSIETALGVSFQYFQRNWRQDLVIGAFASLFSDAIAIGIGRHLASRWSVNSRYTPFTFGDLNVAFPILNGQRTTTGFWRFGGRSLIAQQYSSIPLWYSANRAALLVIPDAISNTGILSLLEEKFGVSEQIKSVNRDFVTP